MPKHDPRVDAYIAKAPDFAKPIVEYVRETVHSAVPEVEETMKWGTPFFEYKGPICMVAAFKEHCRFGFWKGRLVTGRDTRGPEIVMSIKDLPPKRELIALMKKAVQLNEEGVKAPRDKFKSKKPLKIPSFFGLALKRNAKALATFEGLSPSHQREYIEWITEAKTPATREKRIATALEWLAQGKGRNWKYEK